MLGPAAERCALRSLSKRIRSGSVFSGREGERYFPQLEPVVVCLRAHPRLYWRAVSAVLFFIVGIALALVSRLLVVLISGWRMRRRERSGVNGEGSWQAQRRAREPSLAELLAETGWRINPRESDRQLARNAIPLALLVAVAFLFLVGGNSLGWIPLGFVVGIVLTGALKRSLLRDER
jgi:hypothetical protein